MSKVIFYMANGEEQALKFASAIIGSGVNKRSVAALAREIDRPAETVRRWLKKPYTMPLPGAIALAAAVGMSADEIARYFK